MKTENLKRWEIVESRGRTYLRDKVLHEGILTEVHESQTITEDDNFIIIYCFARDFHLKMYSSFSMYDPDADMFIYMFKKWEGYRCYMSFL